MMRPKEEQETKERQMREKEVMKKSDITSKMRDEKERQNE